MKDAHVTERTLVRLARGEAPGVELSEVVAHLEECEPCRASLGALPIEVRLFFVQRMDLGSADSEIRPPDEGCGLEESTGSYSPSSYDGALDSVMARLAAESSRLDRERAAAPGLLAELSRLPPSQQALLIRNSSRFHSWGLAEFLIERSRSTWTEDPARAEQLADLALLVEEQIDATGFRQKVLGDLQSETWSCIANCRRIRSDFRGAGEAFRRAEDLLARGSGDLMERARLFDLKSSYLQDVRDFRGAKRVLGEAIRTYRASGEDHLEGRALLKLAKLYRDSGQPDRSLEVLQRANILLRTEEEPRLALVVQMKLVHYLRDLGRAEEAQAELPNLRTLARAHGNRLDRLRVLWIEGLVCQSLGKVALAREALLQVRQGFIDAEIGYDVALVSLDLAALYLESGRTAEVKELASEMLPQFAARQIRREALAALSLFDQAARQERATIALVDEVASRIEWVRGRSAPDS